MHLFNRAFGDGPHQRQGRLLDRSSGQDQPGVTGELDGDRDRVGGDADVGARAQDPGELEGRRSAIEEDRMTWSDEPGRKARDRAFLRAVLRLLLSE